jgi:sirohydrochlorin cobaltochelatase
MSTALILAIFGATTVKALPAFTAIRDRCRAAFPESEIYFACTSDAVRAVWRRRAADPEYRRLHPQIPADFFSLPGVLAAASQARDLGHRRLVIQPVQVTPAEEYHDLLACVHGLASIGAVNPRRVPFHALALGRPLLGGGGIHHSYHDDIVTVAEALAADAELARREKAVLLYAGHGSPLFPVGGLYLEFAARMRALYPDVVTEMACLEGFPNLNDTMANLAAVTAGKTRRIIIRPLLVAAGTHARRDLAGDSPASWRHRLVQAGWQVAPVMTGLGEVAAIAGIFARHAADAAQGAGFSLC